MERLYTKKMKIQHMQNSKIIRELEDDMHGALVGGLVRDDPIEDEHAVCVERCTRHNGVWKGGC